MLEMSSYSSNAKTAAPNKITIDIFKCWQIISYFFAPHDEFVPVILVHYYSYGERGGKEILPPLPNHFL